MLDIFIISTAFTESTEFIISMRFTKSTILKDYINENNIFNRKCTFTLKGFPAYTYKLPLMLF
jgi:hypothetical protein